MLIIMNGVTFIVCAILSLEIIAYDVSSQSVIYVSRVDGNDSTTCGSQDSPCYSISQAVSQAHFGSSIYLDSSDTIMSPYDCRSLPLSQKGIYVTKTLSFVGGPSLAHVSCRKGQNWIVDGTQSPIAIDVNLTGIAFDNSRLHFVETAVTVKHCVFSNADTLAMNFSIVHRNLTLLVFKDVRFEANEACVSITSSSVGTEQFIGIHIDDSVFNNNGRRRIPIVPTLSWTILGVDTSLASHFVNVEMSNVSFQGNYARTSGMIFVKNELGRTKCLMQDVNFTLNGLHDNTAGNSLIVLRSFSVSFVISQSHVTKSKQRFLSIYSTQAAFNVSHMAMYNFSNSRSSFEKRGGAFYIESDLTKLFIKHCCFANGVAHDHGGLLFVLTRNARIIFENSTAFNLNSAAGGGVLHAMSNGQSNSIRSSNFKEASASVSPVTNVPANERSSYFMLIASHVRFIGNSAAGPGGAVYLNLNFNSTLVFNNVTFRNNFAQRGVGGGAICAGCDNTFLPPFKILIMQCRFEDNHARAGGALHLRGRDGMFVMEHSLFRSNVASKDPGGAIKLQTWKSKINFFNATFVNNNSTDASGGAVYLDVRDQSKVNIDHAKFEQNFAVKSLGAALAISTPEETLNESGCDTKTWRSWNYNTSVKVNSTSFTNNTAGSGGGAVSMRNGMINFDTCTFIDNAASQGSHIINYGTNSLSLINCTFVQNDWHYSTSSLIETFSPGPLLLQNTTVSVWVLNLGATIFTVSRGGLVKLDQFTTMICPSGMFASWKNQSLNDWINRTCTYNVTVLHLQCKGCPSGKYSLQRGYTQGFMAVPLYIEFFCRPCPYEADCSAGISTFGFWGNIIKESPSVLNLIDCPDEYFCYGSQTSKGFSNSCLGNRKDFMCGSCASGYSEKLFSADCKKSQDCNDTLFWLMFLAFVLVMALFLVFKPPIVKFAAQQAFWYKKYCRTKKKENVVNKTEPVAARQAAGGNESTFPPLNEEIENENNQAVGFLEIIFYFYQISNLLTFGSVGRSYVEMGQYFFQGFFNFRGTFFAHNSLECPFPGLTPETKQLFEVAPVFGTLGAIYLIYAVHFIMSKILHTATPTLGRYLGATMETILLGYIKIATVSLSLIRCVSVGNESRWFYNGTIVCYQWWQKVLIAFDVIVVVPFIFVLAWGAVKLHREKVSAKHFLLACVFPLPFLILWLLQSLGFFGNQRQHAQNTEYTKALKDVLLAPFRKPKAGKTGALYWQSIFILRRFVLAFLYCFITDQSFRLLSMGIVCVLALMHHSIKKPFRKNSANTAETVSLLVLVILANINSYNPCYNYSYNYSDYSSHSWILILKHWVEIILLGFLPAMLALMVVFVSVSLITRLIFLVCSACITALRRIQRRLKPSNERAPLLSD